MANRLTRTDASSGLRCSFCGRAPEDGVLVTAPEVAICETCVARSADLLEADDRDETDDQAAADNAGTASVRARLIGEAEVASLISIDDVIEAMKAALPRFSAGEDTSDLKSTTTTAGSASGDGVATPPAAGATSAYASSEPPLGRSSGRAGVDTLSALRAGGRGPRR